MFLGPLLWLINPVLIGPVPITELKAHPGVTGLAIGVFDGVHLGHQAVVKSLAGRIDALTFEPHPLAVIAPDACRRVSPPSSKRSPTCAPRAPSPSSRSSSTRRCAT